MSKSAKIYKNVVLNYDGMAKRLLDAMKDRNLISFINKIFDRNLSLNFEVKRLATETFDEKIKQNRCDYYVCINDEMFLIEIQSYDDNEMAMRVFDYGVRGAKVHGQNRIEDELIELHMPQPVVIFLRKGSNPVSELSVRLISSNNETFDYTAKAIYLDDYSFQDMIDGYMFPMMPFYPLRYEKILMTSHSEEAEKKIFEDLMNNVKLLKKTLENGIISTEDYRYICEWMANTFRAVVTRSKQRKMFVNEMEAERVMQYIVDEPIEGFDIYKALQDSKTEGRNIAHLKDIRSLMETVHFSLDEAMKALKISEEEREEYAKMLAAENNTTE